MARPATGIERLDACFAALRARGERAFLPYLTAGDPDLETTEQLVLAMAEAGADVIELGVPFSDPIADGPTIQRASQRAIASGTTLRRILELVRRVRARTDVPILLMGYANNFFAMGDEAFAKAAQEAGVDAVIVADLPPEEGAAFFAACRAAGIAPVLLAAPTTTPARLAMLARETRGFLYYVSLTGVTSARSELARGIEQGVRAARAAGPAPVCVGFGISTPEQAREVGLHADGVVVGSAIVERIEAAASRADAVDSVARFVAELKAPLREPR
ncbi:MAG: tryptophan synthase subunit alpha [Myxococcota bacterium]|nr:tryptophan synthase subunit alpha [Myxococcales bacterium]